jgi:5-amino-6-(5-phospho-D-ribitylamino)uracil phosphatase
MPIRMIAVDLDGTLLTTSAEISAANRQALCAAVARGVELAIVTGRRFHSARPLLATLGCPLTVISSNGARIGTLGGEVCHRNFLPAAIAREVLRATPNFRSHAVVVYDVPGRGQVVMQQDAALDGPLGWYRKNTPEALLEVPDLETATLPDCPDVIQVLFSGPPRAIEPAAPLLAASPLAPRLNLTWTRYPARNTVLLDVMNGGCTKGAALRLWAARRGIEAHEIMAVGDNHNDREMLEFAGRPVVMANAEPEVGCDNWAKTLSNDEDGVAAAVRRYVLGCCCPESEVR